MVVTVSDHPGCKQTTEGWVAGLSQLGSPKLISAGRGAAQAESGGGPSLIGGGGGGGCVSGVSK